MTARLAYAAINTVVAFGLVTTALVTAREAVALSHYVPGTYIGGYVEAVALMLFDFIRGYDATLPAAYPQLWPLAYALAHAAAFLQSLGGR